MRASTRKAVFSRKRGNWPTPRGLFDRLNAEFAFTLDACADDENAKVGSFFKEPWFQQSLGSMDSDWSGSVWCNPPYGRGLRDWMDKAEWSARNVGGCVVVMLVPARTDTEWWHEVAMRAAEIRFVRGRIRFHGAAAGAPFPSVIVVFRHGHGGPPVVSSCRS